VSELWCDAWLWFDVLILRLWRDAWLISRCVRWDVLAWAVSSFQKSMFHILDSKGAFLELSYSVKGDVLAMKFRKIRVACASKLNGQATSACPIGRQSVFDPRKYSARCCFSGLMAADRALGKFVWYMHATSRVCLSCRAWHRKSNIPNVCIGTWCLLCSDTWSKKLLVNVSWWR
jgi:hypothetical protein